MYRSPLRPMVLPLVAALVLLGCNEPTAPALELAAQPDGLTPGVSFAIGGRPIIADMNDRFANTQQTGANGDSRVVLTQNGAIEIRRVKIKDLLPEHDYVLKVTADIDGVLGPQTVFTSQTIRTNKNGVFQIHNFSLGNLAPRTYRVDLFITHDHAFGSGTPGLGAFVAGVLGTEPLLACMPLYFIVVT